MKIYVTINKTYKRKIVMRKKLINKDIPPMCEYCLFSQQLSADGSLLCRHKGIVDAHDKCRKYKYDILKRKPHIQKSGDDYQDSDFVI